MCTESLRALPITQNQGNGYFIENTSCDLVMVMVKVSARYPGVFYGGQGDEIEHMVSHYLHHESSNDGLNSRCGGPDAEVFYQTKLMT